ncbi:TetR family transcriptional regulator [Cellulomonas sp. KRMCY2]|uniref:TetR/AcrR family transcriptional regulator n=1 Tax=Cellulomonas sp. KRMCY2 TaxID=1304865 RepID=UPI00045EA28E|nr:TetR family transcriptional regulator [Cellulomonas sp. KRMCY2]
MTTAPLDPRTPHPRDAKATTAALLDAARRRFTVLGYAGTKVRDIAADVGVNVSLINRYFGSKEQLFAICLATPSTQTPFGADPGDRTLADDLARHLQESVWPEFGHQHPIMLWLRGPADEPDIALRRAALERFIDDVLKAAGTGTSPELRLRAQLIAALAVGIAATKAIAAPEPLTTASPDELAGPLGEVIEVLLELPPGPRQR